jgi:rhamnose transport system substrate-binding protein
MRPEFSIAHPDEAAQTSGFWRSGGISISDGIESSGSVRAVGFWFKPDSCGVIQVAKRDPKEDRLFYRSALISVSFLLRKALKAGVRVIGYDAESQPDAREWFIQQATPEGIGKALIDSLVAEVGKEADIAIVTSSLTAPNQNAWIAEMKKYISAQGLKLNIVTILPSEEDQQQAFKVTGQILKAYPNVKGIIGLSSVAFPGAADAITQANLIGKIAVTGLSTPNQMKPFVKSGCVKSVILWNPVDLGYAAIYAMRAVVDGKLKPGDSELDAGRLGKLKLINGSQFLLGPPFIFNQDNIDKFDF